MKKITVFFIMSVFFVLCFGIAAYAIHEIIPSETQIVMPGPNAEKLNEYIVRYDPYKAWELWPKKGKLYKGTEPHGSLLTTFINNASHFSIKKKKGMEDGSIIAKENYTADKKFVALTVMYKIKGYNPAAGDWFWAKYNPDGTVAAAGRVKGCIDCHSAKKDNDYIFTGEVKK
jgi:hypothetical protein